MKMRAFLRYTAEQQEENPLYAFDARFDSTLPDLSRALRTPLYFENSARFPNRDLFENMGEERRPDYRWIIIGAAKSGSKWHVDPNHTHAWNALGKSGVASIALYCAYIASFHLLMAVLQCAEESCGSCFLRSRRHLECLLLLMG